MYVCVDLGVGYWVCVPGCVFLGVDLGVVGDGSRATMRGFASDEGGSFFFCMYLGGVDLLGVVVLGDET